MFQINAIGNLGKDAEIKQKDGREFMVFSVAAKVGKDKTQWIDCTMNGSKLAQYLQKGKQVFIQGSGSIENYTTSQGETRTSVRCSVISIQLIGGDRSQPADSQPQVQQQTYDQNQARSYQSATQGDDDLPF